jgi:hypothetical protein
MVKIISSIKNKYGNKKKVVDGVKFDSELEMHFYNLLKSNNLEFEFQKQIPLVEGFRFHGKWIRPITLIVDFVITKDNKKIYVDTKGMATEVSKIKYKMLKFSLMDQQDIADVVWLHSKKEALSFILKLKEKENGITKQSTITW